jgi:hypothetical protein
MYYRNPSSLVFQEGDNWWIETSTGRDAIAVDTVTGKTISAADAGQTLTSEQFEDNMLARLLDNQVLVAEPNFTAGQCAYHVATRNHPFIDMSTGMEARITDAAIMAGYMEADEYPPVYLDINTVETVNLDNAPDLATDELRNSVMCQLSLIISGTFGVRRRQAPYFDPDTNYHQVELLLKSVPSGGGRHPTELFLEIVQAPDIAPGQYHYQPRTNTLGRLSPSFFYAATA